jgi:ABC-type glycerol-3-phosphate transport system permease component
MTSVSVSLGSRRWEIGLDRARRLLPRSLIYAMLIGWLLVTLAPFFWACTATLKTGPEYVLDPLGLPKNPTFDNIVRAWEAGDFDRYLANSVFLSVASLAGVLMLSAGVAFGFARFEFRFKTLLWGFVMLSFLIPIGGAGLIPMVVFMRKVGLYGSMWSLIVVYSLGGVPWNSFFLRAHIETIPRELEEAAVMDGASIWQVFRHIIVPLSIPTLVTLGTFHFMFVWQVFQLPLMMAKDNETYTVAVGVLQLQRVGVWGDQSNPALVATGALMAALPCILVYAVLQRYVVRGMMAGALKGV